MTGLPGEGPWPPVARVLSTPEGGEDQAMHWCLLLFCFFNSKKQVRLRGASKAYTSLVPGEERVLVFLELRDLMVATSFKEN